MSSRYSTDAQELMSQLTSLTDADFAALQNAYYYRWLKSTLANYGWLNLILGGLTLLLGLMGIQFGLLKAIQALLGAIIVGVSLWALVSPSRQTYFGYSILFVLAGAWNLFLGIRDGALTGGLFLMIFGILQLRWAYQTYQVYTTRIPASTSKPSKETMALYASIWQQFVRSRYAHNDQLLEVLFGRERWRGFTFGDYVAFASPKRKQLMFARRSEIAFDANNPDPARKTIQGKFRLNMLVNRAAMQREFYERYLQWKAGT